MTALCWCCCSGVAVVLLLYCCCFARQYNSNTTLLGCCIAGQYNSNTTLFGCCIARQNNTNEARKTYEKYRYEAMRLKEAYNIAENRVYILQDEIEQKDSQIKNLDQSCNEHVQTYYWQESVIDEYWQECEFLRETS